MDQKLEAASGFEYIDFEPDTHLIQEADYDTLLVYLPDFKKEQLWIQLTTTPTLKITGERLLADNKRIRFQKECPVSTNCDTDGIKVKLEGGILYIRQPKLVTSSVEQDLKEKPTAMSDEAQKKPDIRQPKLVTSSVEQDLKEKPTAMSDEAQKKPENDQPQGPQPQKTAETTSTMADQSKQMTEEKGGELPEDENVAKEEGKSNGVDEVGEGTKGKTSDRVSGGGRAAKAKKVFGMLMNLLLGILLAMVVGIYFKNWIKPNKEYGK